MCHLGIYVICYVCNSVLFLVNRNIEYNFKRFILYKISYIINRLIKMKNKKKSQDTSHILQILWSVLPNAYE